MGTFAEERQVRELLAEHATFLRNAKHGDLWALPGGETIQVYHEKDSGNRDWRAWKNCYTELRRKLRAAGLLEDQPQEEDEDEAQGSESEEDNMTDLAALGVHVKRTTKEVVTVVKTERVEATVTASALAQLLGLADMGDQEAEIQVRTFDDNVVGDRHSTFKFVVSKETTESKEGDAA